jgi:protease I
MNPDSLRMLPKAVAFAKAFFDAGKAAAVICHAPWTVIETGYAKGKKIALWPSLKTASQDRPKRRFDHPPV